MSRNAPDSTVARRRQYACICAALADETRLSLVATLSHGEPRSIAQLTGGTRLTRQAVTKHLRVLQHAGIVHSVRRGRESRFEFDPAPMTELQEYLGRVSQQWDQVLSRLRTLVES